MTAFETSSEAACRRDPHGCITCGDEGIVMRVLQVDGTRGLALCETAGGERSTVEIALVDAGPGDDVLVHAGTAIA
ncbi:MAG: HypC/HybG/HupF family hydrogenase formation chaperone [Solirubrobacteraceae bacterium]